MANFEICGFSSHVSCSIILQQIEIVFLTCFSSQFISKSIVNFIIFFSSLNHLFGKSGRIKLNFNTVFRRCVAWIRSSLFVKIQWQKHHYISEHRYLVLFGTCSQVIIMMRKVDPHAEGGARILIRESFIKAIEMCQV